MENRGESISITTEYNLGGENKYIVGHEQEDSLFYYAFQADDKTQIVDVIANLFKSKVYSAKDRGIERIFIMNHPSAYVYFV